MAKKRLMMMLVLAGVFVCGYHFGKSGRGTLDPVAGADSSGRVFELRTYTASEGKLEALNSRFRSHTMKLFEKHGMTNIAYFTPSNPPLSETTLVYLISHPSREAAEKNWAEFRSDPEWQKVRMESEAGGKIVTKVESVFLTPADYSPMK